MDKFNAIHGYWMLFESSRLVNRPLIQVRLASTSLCIVVKAGSALFKNCFENRQSGQSLDRKVGHSQP